MENQKKDKIKSEEAKDTEKVAILVDGNNFYKNLENLNLNNIQDFLYKDFADFLSQGRKIVCARYYKGSVVRELNNPKSEKMFSVQQKLFANLEKQDWEVERGYMMKYREYKKCMGFYAIDEKIKDYRQFKKIGEEILANYKTCYRPIIVITPDFPNFRKFKKETLKKFPGIYVISNKWKEKGVDVKIVVDMLALAEKGECDSIILVSSDSDLLPAVERVKEMGKRVEYIGFGEGYFSTALLNKCDAKRLLTKKEFEKFIPSYSLKPLI